VQEVLILRQHTTKDYHPQQQGKYKKYKKKKKKEPLAPRREHKRKQNLTE